MTVAELMLLMTWLRPVPIQATMPQSINVPFPPQGPIAIESSKRSCVINVKDQLRWEATPLMFYTTVHIHIIDPRCLAGSHILCLCELSCTWLRPPAPKVKNEVVLEVQYMFLPSEELPPVAKVLVMLL